MDIGFSQILRIVRIMLNYGNGLNLHILPKNSKIKFGDPLIKFGNFSYPHNFNDHSCNYEKNSLIYLFIYFL